MVHRRELDGLRALAVLLVIASHLWIPVLAGGWIGVDVFFVLSGYLITSILVREFDQTGSIRLARFYTRRLLRLYPALVAMLIVCGFFYSTFGETPSLFGYLHTATYSGLYAEDLFVGYTGNSHGNLGHTWSLAIEEQFYLLWAPILLLCLKRARSAVPLLIGGIAISTGLLCWATGPNGGVPLTYFRPDRRGQMSCYSAVCWQPCCPAWKPGSWPRDMSEV